MAWLKGADTTLGEPVGGGERRPELTVGEIGESTLKEAKPQASPRRIDSHRHDRVLVIQAGPGNLFDSTASRRETKQT
jgi:hypothetical protein